MGFRINTNIGAMTAHTSATMNNKSLDNSLSRLSSGLRINKAADDASGLSIANSLKAQANGLNQAINNANDGVALVQTADGALDEYTNIINTVRTKSIQAASDGQNSTSRKAIQNDITKLLEEAQNIATTTSFNGQNLLDGNFVNKNFQIGAYANETVGISISSAKIENIGGFAEAEGANAVDANQLTGVSINNTLIADSVAGTAAYGRSNGSAWAKAAAINASTSATGVTATATTSIETAATVAGSATAVLVGEFTINGVSLNGDITVAASDGNSILRDAINAISGNTHVTASIDAGKLTLTNADGGDIVITANANAITAIGLPVATTLGKLTLSSTDSAIQISGTNAAALTGHTALSIGKTENLGTINVSTYDGAQTAIKISDAALKQLDEIRSNLGSTQNQLESTIRNISVTAVNVTSAESGIRDVDFAQESANFSKYNILAQSGSYAMSQANAVQQNVLRLLQ